MFYPRASTYLKFQLMSRMASCISEWPTMYTVLGTYESYNYKFRNFMVTILFLNGGRLIKNRVANNSSTCAIGQACILTLSINLFK